MIYALEGMDAAGKATQAKLLYERLVKLTPNGAERVRLLSFPNYESPSGKVIRNMLQGNYALHSHETAETDGRDFCHKPPFDHALTLQSLMATNRYEQMILLTLAANNYDCHVVCDRYWLSGLVYGAADGLDVDWLRAIHKGLPKASVTVFLDIPLAESFLRRPKRDDTYEADRERLDRVRTGYLTCCDARLAWHVDGVGTVEEVAERIWRAIRWG